MKKYEHEIDMTTNNSASSILRKISRGTKVLEFGPATGYMTRYLKESLACKVYCIEKDNEAAEIATQYCDKMIIDDLDSLNWIQFLEGEIFDHIILADVLEHLKSPDRVIKAAAAFLKDSGTLLTSIPNIGHNAIIMELLKGRFEYRELGLLDETHIHFFTRKSILELFSNANLRPIEWEVLTVPPESTEFRQKYSAFEYPIRKLLLNREDGHVYQYITVTKKNISINEREFINDIQVIYPVNIDEAIEVFWKNGEENFNTENMSSMPLQDNGIFNLYQFDMQISYPKLIRIDPANSCGLIEIESINLFLNNKIEGKLEKVVIASLNVNNKFSGLNYNSSLLKLNVESDDFTALVIDSDPQLFIDLPNINFESAEMSLQINLRSSQNLNEILLKLSKHMDSIRIEEEILQLKVNSLEEKLKLNEELLNQQNFLKEELLARDNLLLSKDLIIASKDSNIAKLKDTNNKHMETNRLLQSKLASETMKYQKIMDSKSWRYTEVLRKIRRIFK